MLDHVYAEYQEIEYYVSDEKNFDQIRQIKDAQSCQQYMSSYNVFLPDCLIKNSVPAILAQISKVLLTRD